MEEKTKSMLLDKLLELELIEKKSEITDSTFVDFEKTIKGIEINQQTLDQMSRYLFGMHQKDRFETVIYYRFLMAENFSQLIADIDKHSEYNLLDYYIRTNLIFDSFYRIELTAKFINFVEILGAIYTVTQEWKKSFQDSQFDEELMSLVTGLSPNFSILKKIRNKLHHAYYVRVQKSSVISASINKRLIAFDKRELLRKVDDLTDPEKELLNQYSVSELIDIKPLVVDCFQEYSTFLTKYQSLVETLLIRVTGTEFRMTI